MADETTVVDVRPEKHDLLLYRGDDFGPQQFIWTQAGVPIDITGYTITAQIRASKDDTATLASFGVNITSAVNGTWEITLTDADTLILPALAYWDMQLKSPGGFTRTFVAGKVKTDKDVTKPS